MGRQPDEEHNLVKKDPGETEEYPTAMAVRMGSRFEVPRPLEAFDFPDKGNINQHTFVIVGGGRESGGEFLLQRINQQVFARPRSVMKSMIACLDAQRQGLERIQIPKGRQWEVIQLIPTLEGLPFLESENRSGTTYWRLMVKIPACHTFKSLSEIKGRDARLKVAEEAGRGLALFGDLTSTMETSGLANPLPGYRDTRVYYDQLSSVLHGNRTLDEVGSLLPTEETLRESTQAHFVVHASPEEYERRMSDPELQHFISLAQEQEEFGMTLLREMESGRIRTVAIHGDTKLDNFLFDNATGQVKALVDLDTIMPHSWLADWGDMVRSLANVAGEKEANLDRVCVDMDIYEAVARGFLSTARSVTDREVSLMVEGVQIIALELGIRFLADYLRGDSYFKLGPTDSPVLNKIRAMAQLRLFERLREAASEARACVETLVAEARRS